MRKLLYVGVFVALCGVAHAQAPVNITITYDKQDATSFIVEAKVAGSEQWVHVGEVLLGGRLNVVSAPAGQYCARAKAKNAGGLAANWGTESCKVIPTRINVPVGTPLAVIEIISAVPGVQHVVPDVIIPVPSNPLPLIPSK